MSAILRHSFSSTREMGSGLDIFVEDQGEDIRRI